MRSEGSNQKTSALQTVMLPVLAQSSLWSLQLQMFKLFVGIGKVTVVKCAALVMAARAQLAQFGISLCAPCWSLLGIFRRQGWYKY
jgi:hypothetical protein